MAQQSESLRVKERLARRGSLGLWKGKTEVLVAWKTGGGVGAVCNCCGVVEKRAKEGVKTAEGAEQGGEREKRRIGAARRREAMAAVLRTVSEPIGTL